MMLFARRITGFGASPLRITFLVTALLPGLCEPTLAAQCKPPRLINTVKMVPLGKEGEVGLRIVLNGVKKTFLFDTGGGTVNIISGAVADELNLSRHLSGRSVNLRGNVSRSAAIVNQVKFGAVKSSNVRFQVMPNLPYDGILSAGSAAMRDINGADVDIDMDFSAMRLNFFSADHCEGDVVYWPHKVLAVVPVTLEQGHIQFTAVLDNHKLTAAIDTGAPWTTLDLTWAERELGFSPQAQALVSSGDGPRDNSDKAYYFHQYFVLFFPGVTVTDPVLIVRPIRLKGSAFSMLRFSTFEKAPDMIIGIEVLRHLHVYYAVKEQKLYITPAASSPAALPEDGAPASHSHNLAN